MQTGVNIGHGLGLFQAAPNVTPQQANALSDIEMQSFWDTFKKIAGTVAHGVQTGVNIGHGLGLFQARQPTATSPVSEVELQNFWKVWNKVTDVAKNPVRWPPVSARRQGVSPVSPARAAV